MVKKNYKRKPRRRRNKKLKLYRTPVPTTMPVKLRYAGYKTLALVSTMNNSQFVRCNSMFDPDETGVGHQPRGFDQFMTLYDHFTVLGARITCTFINRNTTSLPVIAYVALRDTNVGVSTYNNVMELGSIKTKTLSHPEGDQGSQIISKNYSAKRFFGRSPIGVDSLQGTAATNPTEGAFFECGIQTLNTNTFNVDLRYVIDFVAILSEPKQPAES